MVSTLALHQPTCHLLPTHPPNPAFPQCAPGDPDEPLREQQQQQQQAAPGGGGGCSGARACHRHQPELLASGTCSLRAHLQPLWSTALQALTAARKTARRSGTFDLTFRPRLMAVTAPDGARQRWLQMDVRRVASGARGHLGPEQKSAAMYEGAWPRSAVGFGEELAERLLQEGEVVLRCGGGNVSSHAVKAVVVAARVVGEEGRLLEVVPDLMTIEEHGKSKVPGLMDLNLDVLSRTPSKIVIALSHYWKHPSGDMIADPDMEIAVYPALETAEALSYQDSYCYQRVHDGKNQIDVRAKRDLNQFLALWLTNLIRQGHCIKRDNEISAEVLA